MRVVIVDDEPPGRLALGQQLAAMPAADVVAECADGRAAVQAIMRHAPDLVLLDVQMPGMSGFDVLQEVGADAVPAVVFVTAHDRFAVKAFEAHAVDYLLKPIDPDRFREAFERAARRVAQETGGRASRRLGRLLDDTAPREPLERFVVREGGRLVFVARDEVDWIEAAGNYVTLHGGKRAWQLRRTLGSLEARLGPAFIRIRRSVLVRTGAVQALESYGRGSYVVHLAGGARLISSRYAGRELRALADA